VSAPPLLETPLPAAPPFAGMGSLPTWKLPEQAAAPNAIPSSKMAEL
jgi:hypothetical protein